MEYKKKNITAEQKRNEESCFRYLTGAMGLNTAAACGCLSNFYHESEYRSGVLQYESQFVLGLTSEAYTEAVDNGSYKNFADDLAGYGLVQWTLSARKKTLLRFAKEKGTSVGDLEMQLAFFAKEIREYESVWKTLRECENSVDGAYRAAYEVCYFYEGPAEKETVSAVRGNYAGILFAEYHSPEKDAEITGNDKKTEDWIRNAGIKACLFYNCTEDRIIYQYHADDRLPMASITKLVTALAVRELVSDPDNVFFATEEDCADYVKAHDASVAGFVSFPDRRFSVTEYLYGLLLPSGCDAAYTLAKNLGNGDRAAFAEKMNAVSRSLDCRDTRLTDAAGFGPPEEHYSTARDLCRILRRVMQDPLLRDILSTSRHAAGIVDTWNMCTTNPLNWCWEDTFFPYSLGGKTGTTSDAGHCYCGMLERNGQQYVFVELGASFFDDSEEQGLRIFRNVITEIICGLFAESGPFMRVGFSGHYIPVPVGTTVRVPVQTLFNNTSETPHLHFSSGDPKIASVDETGTITVCGKGVARISLVTQTGDYDMLYIDSTGSKFTELKRM